MAKEAWSKIYISSGPDIARIVHPIVTEHPAFFRDMKAAEIWDAAQFFAQSVVVFQKLPDGSAGKIWQSYWSVQDIKTEEIFKVNRMKWSWDEWYLNLVTVLEARKGCSDLTIIVPQP